MPRWPRAVARMERTQSAAFVPPAQIPDYAALYPGYETMRRPTGKTHNSWVNRIATKYSTLPKFGNSVCVAHPGSSLRGDHVVVIFASRVAVDAAASGAGGEGRAGCPCEPSDPA